MDYLHMHTGKISATDLLVAQKRIKARRITQAAIALALGVSQGQVSRALAGRSPIRSRIARQICNYVLTQTRGVTTRSVKENEELIAALAETWDGSDSHAAALAAVIRALGSLSAVHAQLPSREMSASER